MLYKYSGIDANGKKTKSTLEAISLEDAKAKLKSKKIIFTSINQTASYQNINFNFIKKIRNLELSMVSKDISLLLKSGISLGKAMLILKKQYYKNQKLSLFFESINNSLNEGKTFYQSLSLQKNFKLPEFYMQSIKTSEDGGMLSGVLWELSLFLKEQDRISKQISSALLYPLFLLSVSIVMIGFLLSYIVPQIVGVFTTSNQELPKITNFVIWFSSFITNNYHIILLLMVGVISIGIAGYNRSYSFKRNIDSIMLKIPFIGIMIQSNNLSRFCYIASVLLNSGVSFAQAVKLSSNTLTNLVIKEIFLNGAKQIVEGKRLSNVLNQEDFKLDNTFIQTLAIAEETSQVRDMLNNLAIMYKEKNSDKLNTVLSLLEPIMMLVVGGFIGFIVVAMLLPIFSMDIG